MKNKKKNLSTVDAAHTIPIFKHTDAHHVPLDTNIDSDQKRQSKRALKQNNNNKNIYHIKYIKGKTKKTRRVVIKNRKKKSKEKDSKK